MPKLPSNIHRIKPRQHVDLNDAVARHRASLPGRPSSWTDRFAHARDLEKWVDETLTPRLAAAQQALEKQKFDELMAQPGLPEAYQELYGRNPLKHPRGGGS